MTSANTRNNILNQFLDSNDKKKISAILKNLLYQSEEMLEKGIKTCYNQISEETFGNFLMNAIYNDKEIAFKLMDKNNYEYNKKYFIELAEHRKSEKCIKYLKNI
jgi:hypothetical protein